MGDRLVLDRITLGSLIGGTLGGTILTLVFLPALYALWYRIDPAGQLPPRAAAAAA